MEQQIKSIQSFINDTIPLLLLRDKQDTLLEIGNHKYEYVLTSAIWKKIRLFKICKVTLNDKDPLYWAIHNSGQGYINHYLNQRDFKMTNTFEDSQNFLSFFCFKLDYDSSHFTSSGVNEKLKDLKQQYKNSHSNCICKFISSDFNQFFWNQNNKSNFSLRSMNEQYSFKSYVKELANDRYNEEGFISNKQVINFKGQIIEEITLTICFYEKVRYVTYVIQNGRNSSTYEKNFGSVQLQIQFDDSKTETVPVYTEYLTNEKYNFSFLTNPSSPTGQISIKDPSFKKNIISLFLEEKFDKIFDDHQYFINNYVDVFSYQIDKDFSKYSKNFPFKFGSVLLAERDLFYHAAVFIKSDEIVHVKIEKGKASLRSNIFRKDTFSNFISQSKIVKEFRFKLPFYTESELENRAAQMINENYKYSLVNNNCEHLAFTLACNINFSSQMMCSFKKLGAFISTPFVHSSS